MKSDSTKKLFFQFGVQHTVASCRQTDAVCLLLTTVSHLATRLVVAEMWVVQNLWFCTTHISAVNTGKKKKKSEKNKKQKPATLHFAASCLLRLCDSWHYCYKITKKILKGF